MGGRSPAAEEREATVGGTIGAMNGCAAVAGGFDFALAVAEEEGGGTIIGCKTGFKEVEAGGRTMLLDFLVAAAEEEGGGTILGCKAVFEEVEAGGRTMLLLISLAAARAILSLLLQEEHVLRGDHSPRLSMS